VLQLSCHSISTYFSFNICFSSFNIDIRTFIAISEPKCCRRIVIQYSHIFIVISEPKCCRRIVIQYQHIFIVISESVSCHSIYTYFYLNIRAKVSQTSCHSISTYFSFNICFSSFNIDIFVLKYRSLSVADELSLNIQIFLS